MGLAGARAPLPRLPGAPDLHERGLQVVGRELAGCVCSPPQQGHCKIRSGTSLFFHNRRAATPATPLLPHTIKTGQRLASLCK